jgi:predicted metalloendopeptidase
LDQTKAKAQAMVRDLVKAFAKRIDALSWMSPETKIKAKQKLDTLKVGVGYPDAWRDYSGLEIVKGDAFGNAQRAEIFAYRQELAKLHKPVDRGEWWMTPQTVNAVNLPLQNALNFPAAIIQPPYFDVNADAAHNYGSMGAVIGHKSATASTTRAASSTPKDAWQTGGPKPISIISRRLERRLPHNLILTGPLPISP